MFLIRIISRFPLSLLYLLSDFLFLVSFHVVRYRRSLVRTNLRKSFPEKDLNALRKIEREFYRNLCDYAVEMLKLVTISREELARRMVFRDTGIPEELRSEHQSILFLASHQFNWEWLLVSASTSFPIPLDFVYQPISNRFFDQLSLQIRSRFGAYPIKRTEVAREVLKRKHIVRGIATVADQYPGYGRDKKYITPFLHQETAFFFGTNQLAVMTQYPVIYFHMRKVYRGYYEAVPVIVGKPPYEKTSEEVIENYIRAVERTIMEYPAGWLWSHNRWKKRHLQKPAA